MQKSGLICVMIWIVIAGTAQTNQWNVFGNIILTNNGIDPVPAYTLDKPALMANVFMTKGNFIFNPQFNVSVTDFKPWSQTNWLLYKINLSENTWLRVGGAYAFFYKRDNINFPSRPNQLTQVVNQYLPTEISFNHKFSDNLILNIQNWYERGVEWDAVQWGDFFNIALSVKNIRLGDKLRFNFFPSTFIVKNALPFEGFYVAQTSSLFIEGIELGLIGQTVLPLYSKPHSDFSWNIGVQYRF